MTPKLLTTSRGQSTLEALVASMALLTFSVILLALIFFCVLKVQLQFSSHEFLICREISNPLSCEMKFRKELASVLRFGQLNQLRAHREQSSQKMDLQMSFTVLRKKIVIFHHDEIHLPLRPS